MLEHNEAHLRPDSVFSVPGISEHAWRLRARWQLAAIGVLGGFFIALALLGARVPPTGDTVLLAGDRALLLATGTQAYERGDYGAAHKALLSAGAQGSAEAQELLGIMYAAGESIYPGIPANPRAASWWLNRAAMAGRPAARYLKCALARRNHSPVPAAHCFARNAAS